MSSSGSSRDGERITTIYPVHLAKERHFIPMKFQTVFCCRRSLRVDSSPHAWDTLMAKIKMVNRCAVPMCPNKSGGMFKMHRFPKDEKIGELTPKAKKLYKIAAGFRKTARKLFHESADLKKKLKDINRLKELPQVMGENINKVTYDFIMSQLKLQHLPAKGRRYSIQDKTLSLALLKQSPRGYKLLQKLFALPSRKTLIRLLQKIPFETGINNSIMQLLKNSVNKMEPRDRYCTIMFDEIALDAACLYNKKKDIIDGFQDNGGGDRKPFFADKAMVFMARGICRPWKQPLAYYFNEAGMKKEMLAKTIKDIIRSARSVGLKVIATVCDQGTSNVAAIDILYQETAASYARNNKENRNFGVEIDGEEVIPLYDSPHLLKGIRNALFNYDVKYTWRNGQNKIASWKYIKKLYELEDQDNDYKLCNKLTDAHINNSKKMKVNVAAQTFSARVAAAIKCLAVNGKIFCAENVMPEEAINTSEFLLFMDKCFDSVNGSKVLPVGGKNS
ncbi:hypothetical protein NQ317_016579 [Molorchus minor]|uniref:Transposase n=1 Tax=Molorchus minor TaxID=1323400 RepID=A0ABQ9J7U7_9CUCU|nr:hypothetical protein NQ317_016579 [Molorchus minor]